MSLDEILAAYKSGELDLNQATSEIRGSFFQDLGHSTLDNDRAQRTGAAEVIYGESKTADQIVELVAAMADADHNVLVTRTTAAVFERVQERFPGASFHAMARAMVLQPEVPTQAATPVAVVTAGTSDLPVAEEAAVTAEFYGNPVVRINDVGVAGVHRLLARMDEIRACRVIVVVAGTASDERNEGENESETEANRRDGSKHGDHELDVWGRVPRKVGEARTPRIDAAV